MRKNGKNHHWVPQPNGEKKCSICNRVRRLGTGPRGGTCWEYKDDKLRSGWGQYISGSNPGCKGPEVRK